jgi:hypothetical protein
MELARAVAGAGSLGNGTARRASLGVVGQPLRGEECLLAGREEKLLSAVATGQTTVLVHALQTLLGSDAMTVEPTGQAAVGSATGERERGARPVGPGWGPELIAEKIRAPSSPRQPAVFTVNAGGITKRVLAAAYQTVPAEAHPTSA